MGSGSDHDQEKRDEAAPSDIREDEAAAGAGSKESTDDDTGRDAPSGADAAGGEDASGAADDEDAPQSPRSEPAPARDVEPAPEQKDAREEPPIVDPLVRAGELSEAERLAVENLSVRAGWLAIASFVAGGLGCLIALTSLSGRVDVGVVVTVLPLGLANIALGVALRRTARRIDELARDKLRSKKPLLVVVSELHTVFMIQLLAAFYLALLQVLSLTFMLIMRHSAEI